MGDGSKRAVELIGDVAKKAKDAVMIPVHGAFALAKAVVGGDDRRETRDDKRRPRGDRPSTKTRPSETDTSDEAKTPTSRATVGDDDESSDGAAESATASTSTSEAAENGDEEEADPAAELEDVWGVGASRADDLREAGFESVRDVAEASVEALSEISGIGQSTAEKMIDSAEELVEG